MRSQSDVIATRLFRACEAPNLRACQAIAAPIVGAWYVSYGYNDTQGYWVHFAAENRAAMDFSIKMFGELRDFYYNSKRDGFTRADLIGCLLAVDAQACRKLPK